MNAAPAHWNAAYMDLASWSYNPFALHHSRASRAQKRLLILKKFRIAEARFWRHVFRSQGSEPDWAAFERFDGVVMAQSLNFSSSAFITLSPSSSFE